MELPIYINGEQEGRLTMEKQGAVTVMRAELRDVGRVVRLFVFGEKDACLGVPVPENGKLRLTRRLSPSDMRRFPQKPEYAAERRLAEKPAQEEQAASDKAQTGEKKHILWLGGKPFYF